MYKYHPYLGSHVLRKTRYEVDKNAIITYEKTLFSEKREDVFSLKNAKMVEIQTFDKLGKKEGWCILERDGECTTFYIHENAGRFIEEVKARIDALNNVSISIKNKQTMIWEKD